MRAKNISHTILFIVGAAVLSAGCKSTNLGGDIGRDIGNLFGRDSGFNRGGYYGGKVGTWLESEIFASLNARDEAELSVATKKAAETGRPEAWGSAGSGAHGSATAKAPETASGSGGASCRIVEQSATLPDGRTGKKKVQACKMPDGSWTIKPVA